MTLADAIRVAFEEAKSKLPAMTGIASEPILDGCGGGVSIYQTKEDGQLVSIGHFTMSTMPGCRPVIICNNVGVAEAFRHHGIGSWMQELRLRAAQLAGVQVLLCTVRATNQFQLRIMQKYDWKPLLNFVNPHTDNRVILFMREIKHDATEQV